MKHYLRHTALIIAFVDLLLPKYAFPKKFVTLNNQRSVSITTIKQAETILSPYFEAKSDPETFAAYNGYVPSSHDIRFLAINYKNLSNKFKELYKKAITIPSDFLSFNSPGGHFKIFYKLTGTDAVSNTDTIGYGTNPQTWNNIKLSPNGIPDYVDNVAWACDSVWNMEIERFKFSKPYPISGTINSRYQIKISNLSESLYGMTYPEEYDSTTPGFRSILEIRNNWNGWNINKVIDYETHPKKGIRITIAHEFFHALQYAVTWSVKENIYLDNFPISWIEGTAVLMEDLAFDYVNDYTQYLDEFFNMPTLPMLDNTYNGISEYKNAIITKYLYEKVIPNDITFIKHIFDNNSKKVLTFNTNLVETSKYLKKTWKDILGDFFTESYFTNNRTNLKYFLKDSYLFDKWKIRSDKIDINNSVTKYVKPYSMQTFVYSRTKPNLDSLSIIFTSFKSKIDNNWSANIILTENSNKNAVILSIPITSDNLAKKTITNWNDYDTAIVIITNSDPQNTREATVYFSESGIADNTLILSNTVSIYPIPASLSSKNATVTIQGKYLRNVNIFTINGDIVANNSEFVESNSTGLIKTTTGFSWLLQNNSGNNVYPGTYIIESEYTDENSDILHRKHQKILVIP